MAYQWKFGGSWGGGSDGYSTLEGAEEAAQSYEEQGFVVTRGFDEQMGLYVVTFRDEGNAHPDIPGQA